MQIPGALSPHARNNTALPMPRQSQRNSSFNKSYVGKIGAANGPGNGRLDTSTDAGGFFGHRTRLQPIRAGEKLVLGHRTALDALKDT